MGLEALLTHLHDETRTRAETVRREAVERARAMSEAAEADFSRRLAEGVAERERTLAADAGRRLSEVRREARLAVLAARERVLGRVYAAAVAAFERVVRDPAYHARLGVELAQALALVPPPAVVRCRPGLEKVLAAAATHLGHGADALAITADASRGPGFVLTAADGSVTVDATLTARLQRAWPALAIEVLQALEAKA